MVAMKIVMDIQTTLPIDLSNYPAHPSRIPSLWPQLGDYEVSYAKSEEELDEVFQLRYRVFNLEMQEGLEKSHEFNRDFDAYDETCHHVLVRHRPTKVIIGTYRVQTRDMTGTLGFYAEEEFRFEFLPDDLLNSAVEVGRACIDKGHRNGRVLIMLWRGVIRYLIHNQKRYLFGCCSISSQDVIEGEAVRCWLERHGYILNEYPILPQPGFECCPPPGTPIPDQVSIPTLMRLYLQNELKVLGRPAVDRTFKTIDYFVLLDLEWISEKTRKLFFRESV